MTIKELIKYLQKFDDRHEVEVRDEDGTIFSIEDVEEDEGHIYIEVVE